MKNYTVRCDIKGRLRCRFGVKKFNKLKENAIIELIYKFPFVHYVEAHSENGSILVLYENSLNNKKNIIDFFDNINFSDFNESINIKNDYQITNIDNDFSNKIIYKIIKRLFIRIIVPINIRRIDTVFQSLKFLKLGYTYLFNKSLSVEVLDAISITTSILKKDYKTANMIMFLLGISGDLEEYTKNRTKAKLKESLFENVQTVWKVYENSEKEISINDLIVGDIIRVRVGSFVPIDGVVVNGVAMINESAMTGESVAAMKDVGKIVYASTVVEEGCIDVEVKALASDTKINHIINLIDNSEQLKASIQSKAERLSDSIVPYNFLGFFIVYFFTRNISKALSLLMVNFSCAIKLSTPISIISALKEAADKSITIKGGKFLELYSNANTIVFDKTGTLTNAVPTLRNVKSYSDLSENEILKIAACIEEHFPHSVANAIVNAAKNKNLKHEEEHTKVEYVVAHGIATTFNGKKTYIGSYHFVAEDEKTIIPNDINQEILNNAKGASIIYLSIDKKLAGVLYIDDPPRKEAKQTIKNLKERKINKIIMLTGDGEKAAELVATTLGIDEYIYNVLPEDKHKKIEELKKNDNVVIMVGDGINDSPALAASDVSVAMNDSSDIAKETADITIRSNNLNDLVLIKDLSDKLLYRINKNYKFIVEFNSALILLGLFSVITPGMSAFLHNMSTMLISIKSMTPLLETNKL